LNKKHIKGHSINWPIIIIPFVFVVALCVLFVAFPEGSYSVLGSIRKFVGDDLGSFYLFMGLGAVGVSLFLIFSKYGRIRLGAPDEKPLYSNFQWGAMMFTAGIAADIVFYSFCEWLLYANEDYISNFGSIQDWASSFPLFHWGPTAWAFYCVTAVVFGYMLYVRKVNKRNYSEACRPVLGKWTDRWPGRLIDFIAVIALIAGTATTFSLATPLVSQCFCRITGIIYSPAIDICVLVIICIIYSVCVFKGMGAISWLAKTCIYIMFALLAYVFFAGGEARYIIETGITAIGSVAQNFIGLSTKTDALRLTGFPQSWTFFYWAYWMVWCIATPFFIGQISKGRTVRQVVLGCWGFGLAGSYLSFIVLGNYGLGLQMLGRLDLIGMYASTGDLYSTIIAIIDTLPVSQIVHVIVIFLMIAFYATSFDSISLVAASYSTRDLETDEEPKKGLRLLWAILLILLPIALLFTESSMVNLQTVSIIAALPIGIVLIIMAVSFFKDANRRFFNGGINKETEQQSPKKPS